MAFSDQLDKKQTIKKGRIVLQEYGRFLKIVNNLYQDMSISSSPIGKESGGFLSYVNYDAQIIENIERKDRQYEDLVKYIGRIRSCIELLDLEQVELINWRYVDRLSIDEIQERYRSGDEIVSIRTLTRILNQCCLDFAITYGVYEVKKSLHREPEVG